MISSNEGGSIMGTIGSGINRSYPLFGSIAEFFVDADVTLAEAILNDAYNLALRLQKIFNLYDEASEISLLNKNRKIKASDELLKVLKTALRLCELSDGEYDISLGKQFLQRKKSNPLTRINCTYKDIDIDGEKIILHHPDVWIDLGSIAKGYIAERVAEFLIEQGIESGYIDARGDLAVFGDEREVDIQHPRSEEIIHTIKIKDKGVATSGDYKQYVKDYSNSHILNQKDVISATVIADSLMEADAYATILMVCNPDVRELMINEAGFPAMIVDKHLNVIYYNGFERLIHEN
jgi:thiamine biosynthesis lipoprotein